MMSVNAFCFEWYLFGLLFVGCMVVIFWTIHKNESMQKDDDWNIFSISLVAGVVASLATLGISCAGRLIAMIIMAWNRI